MDDLPSPRTISSCDALPSIRSSLHASMHASLHGSFHSPRGCANPSTAARSAARSAPPSTSLHSPSTQLAGCAEHRTHFETAPSTPLAGFAAHQEPHHADSTARLGTVPVTSIEHVANEACLLVKEDKAASACDQLCRLSAAAPAGAERAFFSTKVAARLQMVGDDEEERQQLIALLGVLKQIEKQQEKQQQRHQQQQQQQQQQEEEAEEHEFPAPSAPPDAREGVLPFNYAPSYGSTGALRLAGGRGVRGRSMGGRDDGCDPGFARERSRSGGFCDPEFALRDGAAAAAATAAAGITGVYSNMSSLMGTNGFINNLVSSSGRTYAGAADGAGTKRKSPEGPTGCVTAAHEWCATAAHIPDGHTPQLHAADGCYSRSRLQPARATVMQFNRASATDSLVPAWVANPSPVLGCVLDGTRNIWQSTDVADVADVAPAHDFDSWFRVNTGPTHGSSALTARRHVQSQMQRVQQQQQQWSEQAFQHAQHQWSPDARNQRFPCSGGSEATRRLRGATTGGATTGGATSSSSNGQEGVPNGEDGTAQWPTHSDAKEFGFEEPQQQPECAGAEEIDCTDAQEDAFEVPQTPRNQCSDGQEVQCASAGDWQIGDGRGVRSKGAMEDQCRMQDEFGTEGEWLAAGQGTRSGSASPNQRFRSRNGSDVPGQAIKSRSGSDKPRQRVTRRSMAERRRRERISEGLQRLRVRVRGRGDTCAMLDRAVKYVDTLERRVMELELVALAAGGGARTKPFAGNAFAAGNVFAGHAFVNNPTALTSIPVGLGSDAAAFLAAAGRPSGL
ncbi:hypothetical protein CLOP_g21390 [Closterium sp. NIES-67]|nr:hypothetical protein CLOP_g21390 [Closterium sp. NIES-67]